jgi:hypothetical protein
MPTDRNYVYRMIITINGEHFAKQYHHPADLCNGEAVCLL